MGWADLYADKTLSERPIWAARVAWILGLNVR